MNILLLPNKTGFDRITDIDESEARQFIETRLAALLRSGIRMREQQDTKAAYYQLQVPTQVIAGRSDTEELAAELSISTVPRIQGRRAAYVGDDGTILIGTTVIYNERHATTGFIEPGLDIRLLSNLGGACPGCGAELSDLQRLLRGIDELDHEELEAGCLTLNIDEDAGISTAADLEAYLLGELASLAAYRAASS